MMSPRSTAAEARRSEPAAQGKIEIVRREDLPTLSTVLVDGEVHSLGVHKDFRRHPLLDAFIPAHARVSMSWVRLGPGESLTPHLHDTDSLIVVSVGQGRITGDLSSSFSDGDVITIPAGCLHGFVGEGPTGYWALSFQFDGRGLYEDPERARVVFGRPKNAPPSGYDKLLERNADFARRYRENPMFTLVTSGALADPAALARYLDAVQVWSNGFQKMLLTRSAVNDDARFHAVFTRHLDEEYGHNTMLEGDRKGTLKAVWDPALEAASSWFSWKMLTSSNAEKTVLTQLVLEVGSSTFHEVANPILSPIANTRYFEHHDEHDDAHATMGLELLRDLDEASYARLFAAQEQGWDMLNLISSRMAAHALGA